MTKFSKPARCLIEDRDYFWRPVLLAVTILISYVVLVEAYL